MIGPDGRLIPSDEDKARLARAQQRSDRRVSRAPATPAPARTARAGGGGRRAAAGTPGQSIPTGTSTTADVSPYLKKQMERYDERLSADTTQRAIDRSNLGIADSAALLAADAKANMSQRGILGTGAGNTFLSKRIFEPAQREAAGAAADISLGRERDLDALVLGGTSLMTAPDAIGLANQQLQLSQQGLSTDQAFRARQAEIDNAFRAQQAKEDQDRRMLEMVFGLAQNSPGGLPAMPTNLLSGEGTGGYGPVPGAPALSAPRRSPLG